MGHQGGTARNGTAPFRSPQEGWSQLLVPPFFPAIPGFRATGQAKTTPPAEAATPAPNAKQIAAMRAKLADWPQLNYYRSANAVLPATAPGEQRVVIYGASVAEFWKSHGYPFFPGKPYVDRGIGGQTSAQMLVRFRQ